MPLFAGQLINNRYRIDALLNQDDSGALYRAWDMNLKIPVAIMENIDLSVESRQQFGYEAETLVHLSHSNLPRILDYFTLPNQGRYVALDLVEGEDLQTTLERQGALPQSDALGWLAQVSGALAYLRSQAELELFPTVEPANIVIRPDGRAALTGFNLLSRYNPDALTEAEDIAPGYSAPELYGHGEADVRSDVYTLGAILYHLLTGQTPPESVQLIAGSAKLPRPSRLNPEITPEVERTILQAMSPDAGRRFQSLEAFQGRLLNLQSELDAPFAPAAQAPSRSLWPLWLSMLANIILVGIAAVAIYFALQGRATLLSSGELAVSSTATPASTEAANWRTPTLTAQSEEVSLASVAPLETLPATADESVAESAPADTPAPVDTPAATDTPAPAPTVTPTSGPVATITDALTGAPLALVPAGPFTMGGASASEDGRLAHTVILDDFYMDQYEVTNAQYAACVTDGACRPPTNAASYTRINYYGDAKYDAFPVVQVNWEQAATFCAWRGARLPTEAEWEKAARGTDERTYPWGETLECSLANYWSAVSGACVGDTVAVGSYPELISPYGLYDMSGNVWEWVADWYAEDYYANSVAENPRGPESGELKVLRGGSWVSNELNARSAFRNSLDPTSTSSNIGLRCVAQQ